MTIKQIGAIGKRKPGPKKKSKTDRYLKTASLSREEMNLLWLPLEEHYGYGDSAQLKKGLEDSNWRIEIEKVLKSYGIDLEVLKNKLKNGN